MTDPEAILSALAHLSREADAQRRRADALGAWQDSVARVLQPFLDGQPEVRPGVPAAAIVKEYLGRLVRERDEARASLDAAAAQWCEGRTATWEGRTP